MQTNAAAFHLPATGFVRVSQIVKLVPLSRSHIWALARSGEFPKPVKLTPGCTAWRVEDVRAWIDERSREKVAA